MKKRGTVWLCIRKRRGKFVVDHYDHAGIRRWITCDTKRAAEKALHDALGESHGGGRPEIAANISVEDFAAYWLDTIEPAVKPRTLDSYRDTLNRHILPALGNCRVRDLGRTQIKKFLVAKLKAGRKRLPRPPRKGKSGVPALPGLSRNSVRIIHATLRAMLNAAIDDEVILRNPAERLGKALRLATSKATRQEQIKAFTREQLQAFLATKSPDHDLFFLLARTGLRLGEGLALQRDDLDYNAREIRVARAVSDGEIQTPKSGHGRTVDMSQHLRAALQQREVAQKAAALRDGKPLPQWFFYTASGNLLDPANVRRSFKKVLKAANLPRHFTVDSLRHTFASLLLQQGESPAYVQRQLGHASIQLTVDTYGKWLPLGNKSAVDRLDDDAEKSASGESGSKVVANCDFRARVTK